MTCRGRYLVSLITEKEKNIQERQECTDNTKDIIDCVPSTNKTGIQESCCPENFFHVSDENTNDIIDCVPSTSKMGIQENCCPENLFHVSDGAELLIFKKRLRARRCSIKYADSKENEDDFSIDNLSAEYLPTKQKSHNTDSDSTTTASTVEITCAGEENSLISPSDLGIEPVVTKILNEQLTLSSTSICNSYLDRPDILQNDSLRQQYESPSTSRCHFLNCIPERNQPTNRSGVSEHAEFSMLLINNTEKRNYPAKTNPGRKRERNEANWKMNVLKKLRNSGLEYTNKHGKLVKKRHMKPGCNIEKPCLQKCHTKFSVEQRKNLFTKFWELGDHDQQITYLSRLITKKPRKTVQLNNINSRRHCTYEYYLPTDGEKLRICKKMFLDTFDITDMWVTTLFKKTDKDSGMIPSDGRGKHLNRGNAIDANIKASVRQHINSIPVKESHYVRQRSSKLYFDESLSFPKLYKLYLERMTENLQDNHSTATMEQYRQIFNKEFNIEFFKPKKDQCLKCEIQQTASQSEKQAQESDYSLHIANKCIIRELKNKDKAEARQSHKTILTACFDLQKILCTPQSEISAFYYKRKFQVFNFTIFDIGKAEGYCYVWNECIGKKGPNEIASFLYDFMKIKAAEGTKEFRFYSDSCGGQNKNRVVFLMFSYASKTLGINIVHNFFEVGHSQSEVDSMHALIERRKKNQVIYIPQQWYTLIRCAKTTGKLYEVKEVTQTDIIDFKSMLNHIPNWEQDGNNNKVMWSKIQHLKIDSDSPNIIHFQNDFYSDNIQYIDLEYNRNKTRRQNKNNKSIKIIWDYPVLPIAYEKLLPIKECKYMDLMSLCSSGAIPELYRDFYYNLPHSNNISGSSETED